MESAKGKANSLKFLPEQEDSLILWVGYMLWEGHQTVIFGIYSKWCKGLIYWTLDICSYLVFSAVKPWAWNSDLAALGVKDVKHWSAQAASQLTITSLKTSGGRFANATHAKLAGIHSIRNNKSSSVMIKKLFQFAFEIEIFGQSQAADITPEWKLTSPPVWSICEIQWASNPILG